MTEKYQPIPHRLKNMAVGGHVAGAVDILDDNLNRNQQDINGDTYRKAETYSKEQLNYMITTPEQKYENYTATSETTDVTDLLPEEGKADTTYRVGCWDGTQYAAEKFTEYSWDGTQYILLSVQDYGIDEVPTDGSHRFVESGGVYNKTSFIEDTSPYNDQNVLKYVVADNNKVLAIIYKDGSIKRLALTPEQKEEVKIIKMTSSNSPFNDDNVLKYLTDEENRCFGYIEKDGTVVLYKAKLLNYKDEGGGTSESQFATTITLLANGVDNIDISNNPKFMATLGNMFTDSAVSINGENENKLNLKPCISIIDDDTIDNQIPSSKGESATVDKQGGYFSVLLPFMLSLGAKYEKKLVVGLACEGQRVGFTPIYNPNDNYTALNENGECVKWLHDNMGWNVFNHSMTAQLPMNTYYVDGIESELADQIKNDCNYLSRPYSFHNWIVLDRLTGKWYEINNVSSTLANKVWTERENPQKYAIPFYRDYITNKWYFNRDFDFEYSWGEWCKRADELGLPYEKVIVHNGGTSHECTVSAGRKYAYWSVRTIGTHNYPPIQATVNRIKDGYEDGVSPNNARNEAYEDKMKLEVDKCLAGNTWMVFMSHFNDQTYHRNYYLDNVEYPDGDPNYPDEWVIPLKHQEIQDIIGENEHDYINNPPSRLEISTWDEWYPAPGTQLKSLYDVLDYALSKGIDIVAPVDGWTTHGNVLNLGVDTNGQTYGYDTYGQTPLTNEEKSYLTIGADGSIRYYNSKQQ
jgi:hypothetical protein